MTCHTSQVQVTGVAEEAERASCAVVLKPWYQLDVRAQREHLASAEQDVEDELDEAPTVADIIHGLFCCFLV